MTVRNLHHHKIATNCYVYLEKVIKLDVPRVEIPFGSVELKWAGYTLPNAHILPQAARPFDALFTHHTQPTLVGFNVFSDSSLFSHPPIQAAGEYEFR